MKGKVIVVLLFVLLTGFLSAEVFRIGGVGAVEVMNNPINEEFRQEFDNEIDIIPGLYWEVILGKLGFGMTYLVNFTPIDTEIPDLEYEWYLDWIGSWDFRYHILSVIGRSGIDPFLEIGFGNAGRVDISNYENSSELRDPLQLSLFVQGGAGIALRLQQLHLGGKLLYRIGNSPVPATQFEIYPLKNFQIALFGGFSI
jgi:hypothetical protein